MEYWGSIGSANIDFFMGRKITIIYIISLFNVMDHIKKNTYFKCPEQGQEGIYIIN